MTPAQPEGEGSVIICPICNGTAAASHDVGGCRYVCACCGWEQPIECADVTE